MALTNSIKLLIAVFARLVSSDVSSNCFAVSHKDKFKARACRRSISIVLLPIPLGGTLMILSAAPSSERDDSNLK